MGIIISKFRKKKSSEEVLESIEETICSIEESQKESELQQKKIRQFSYLSVTFLVIAAFSYIYFFAKTLRRPQTVLIIIPVLVLGEVLRRVITWYYQRKVKQTQKKLIDLRAKKKKILDEVMNNETFNKAKEILEKFAPDQLPKRSGMVPIFKASPAGQNVAKTPASVNNVKKSLFPLDKSVVPFPASSQNLSLVKSHPSHNLPRPILPTDKTVLERLVELIVGDGPSQRFALICSNCNSHNGMALKEEFEYLAYKCAYCYHFNPARKQRLVAPKLPDHSNSWCEDSSFNSSIYGLKGAPSSGLKASILLKDLEDDGSLETRSKARGELGGGSDAESEFETMSANIKTPTGQEEGEPSCKMKGEEGRGNKSDEEVDVESFDQMLLGAKEDLLMEVDKTNPEEDMGEYVSDEDSLSETETMLKNTGTAKAL